MQVANVVFSFDPSLPPGRRISQENVLVGGKALELSRLYTVGVKAYLVQGKDGFECLTDVRCLILPPCFLPAACVSSDAFGALCLFSLAHEGLCNFPMFRTVVHMNNTA